VVLLHHGILSNAVFFVHKFALKFYLTRVLGNFFYFFFVKFFFSFFSIFFAKLIFYCCNECKSDTLHCQNKQCNLIGKAKNGFSLNFYRTFTLLYDRYAVVCSELLLKKCTLEDQKSHFPTLVLKYSSYNAVFL
jgi:hypothetical protein